MQRLFAYAMFIVSLTMFSACASTAPEEPSSGIWKTTKNFYREYIDRPASVDMKDLGPCTDYEVCLGGAIAEVDTQLRELQRVMENSDRSPDQKWATMMIRRFPWLSGIALTDAHGTPMARFPEHSMKPFDVENLLNPVENQRKMSLRASVTNSPLGPEVYLGKPVYVEGDFRGLVVAHFDMRVLLSVSSNPGAFMVASQDILLWPGIYDANATPVPGTDWSKLVSGGNKGTISNNTGTFYWMSTYFANLPLIYTLPSKGTFPERPEQLDALKQADVLAAPDFTRTPGTDTLRERALAVDSLPVPDAGTIKTEPLKE